MIITKKMARITSMLKPLALLFVAGTLLTGCATLPKDNAQVSEHKFEGLMGSRYTEILLVYDNGMTEDFTAGVYNTLGLNGAKMVFIPSATSRGLSEYLWRIEQVSHAVANGYFVGTINRVGIEADIGDNDFYGQSYFCDPRGQFIGSVGSPNDEEMLIRDLDLEMVKKVRETWQFYRDRRPDAYGDLTRP